MKKIYLKKDSNFNETDFYKRSASEEDFDTLIKEDSIFHDENTGSIIGIYIKNIGEKHISLLKNACDTISYNKGTRISGIKTESAIFGYSPRVPLRSNFCTSTSMSRTHKKEHKIITDAAKIISDIYKAKLPDFYNTHDSILKENVLEQYKIPGTPFTSGIVNKNNPLKYHYDSGNFEGVYSNMIGIKHKISGGYLSIPEYRIGLEIGNGSLSMFDGQKILHGVTPMKKMSEDAMRYTLVYYSLKGMWNCLPFDEEIAKIRESRRKQEIDNHNKRKNISMKKIQS